MGVGIIHVLNRVQGRTVVEVVMNLWVS